MLNEVILIVDDQEINRTILCEIFKESYKVVEAENGREAIDFVKNTNENIACILLDIVMPELDGFGVLDRLTRKDYLSSVPVVLITGDTSVDAEKKGYDKGVSDIITKPFDLHIVKKRVENIIDLYRHKNNLEAMVTEQAQRLKDTNAQIIEILSSVVEFRNLESGEHIKRIKAFTRVLAEYVSVDYPEYKLSNEIKQMIVSASAMHDVGKIAIPDTILLKPGKLTDEEFDIMKTHTVKGAEIMEMLDFIEDRYYYKCCVEIARHHHERFDGRGYPDKLVGDDIPIAAQIVSITDVYDALVSERVYKSAFTPEEAYNMILEGKCGTFNPKLMECFKKAKEDFEFLVKDNG